MLLEKIDVEKSIRNQMVCREMLINYKISNFIVYSVLVFIIPFFSIINLVHNFDNEFFILNILFLIFSIFLSSILVYSILNSSKLRIINGLSVSTNKEIIISILKELSWSIKKDDEKHILAVSNWDEINWYDGKKIVIIYSKNIVLINCVTYTRKYFASPFHWFINRKKENEIIKEFEKQIKIKKEIQIFN